MKKKHCFLLAMACLPFTAALAQRQMENLDRGTVAVPTADGVYVGWRIFGTEYYDTQYNLYRDGTKVNDSPLDVSNYLDKDGTASSVYTVRAVSKDVEQEPDGLSAAVWEQPYLAIPMGKVYSRRGTDITADYQLNDASAADLDGDGQMEFIIKRIYAPDGLFDVANDSAFCMFEAYKMDGTRLWTIDCGPNLISSGHVETNLVAFDWDGDGKAELLMRAADGTILHTPDGDQVIGDATKNYRNMISHSANMTYATAGDEFLLYMEGATARLYNRREFPLKRLESGETDLEKAWGDGYGHRSNKFFFGAPYLDGRRPSIYLGRGIYTRHKMIAYDVNPDTHELTERWRWDCNTGGPWYGQGYHNYGIADVDWDGRDEIVYGSMVIDDNGKGLSTTGLGHGDAQHCSDLDPFRKGQEIFACNENAQGANYRDATTSQIYYWHSYGRDCGRAMAGNFTDKFFGSQMVAPGLALLSSVTNGVVEQSYTGIGMNFPIYWDGDLCRESLDGNDTEGAATVSKYGVGVIFSADGTKMNNWTKNTPALQADVLGDWREEIIARSEDNMELRIYTTTDVTPWRNYTLLHDMQYRQAVMWQMCGYNQPPHTSYFLGRAEGITVAPPPVMTNGRVEVTDAITDAQNGSHVLLAETAGGTVNVSEGAAPYILTVNAFSHTQGNDNNDNITADYATYTLTGGGFAGSMRLVKQGEGRLVFGGTQNYTGETALWGGTTVFNGTLAASRVWMNRFAELDAAGTFGKAIEQSYGSVLRPGGKDAKATLRADSLILGFGAIVEFDIYGDDLSADNIELYKALVLGKINVQNGPQYQVPVFRFTAHPAAGADEVPDGIYRLIKAPAVEGDLQAVVIEGLDGRKKHLEVQDGYVCLVIDAMRSAATVYWNGGESNGLWDFANTLNFNNEGQPDFFVTGDKVIFDDAAEGRNIRLAEELMPSELLFSGTADYTMSGTGYIAGTAALTKQGTGQLTISNVNRYTGKTTLEGGTTVVASLADEINNYGALGAYSTEEGRIEIRNGAVLKNTVNVTNAVPITVGEGGAELNCGAQFEMKGAFKGGTLVKSGTGTLVMSGQNSLKSTVLKAGAIRASVDGVSFGDTLIFEGGTYYDCDNIYSYSGNANNFCVRKRKTGTFSADARCNYTGRLYGEGTFKVDVHNVRTYLQGNWSAFEGTVEPVNATYGLTLDNAYGLPKASLDLSSGCPVTNTGKSFTIGEVTGSGSLGEYPPFGGSGANTWIVGSLGTDFSFSGTITGAATVFKKVGAGKMSVSGYSTFGGACTVEEGTLQINKSNAAAAMLGTGVLTVESGAMLVGQGKLGNSSVSIAKGATLRPGSSETSIIGTIDFSDKNVTVQTGATLQFYVNSKTTHTELTGINLLNLRGTLKVLTREGLQLAAGDEIRLWEADRTTLSANLVLELSSPGTGLEWDTTSLSEGILRVQIATGVSDVQADSPVKYEIFRLDGTSAGVLYAAPAALPVKMRAAGYKPDTYVVSYYLSDGVMTDKLLIEK